MNALPVRYWFSSVGGPRMLSTSRGVMRTSTLASGLLAGGATEARDGGREIRAAAGREEPRNGRRSPRRPLKEDGEPLRRHRPAKPERKKRARERSGGSRGSRSNAKRRSSRPSARRQVTPSGPTP